MLVGTIYVAGQDMLGAWLSVIETVNRHDEVRLPLSNAEQVTSVSPTGKTDPEDGMHDELTTATLSNDVTENDSCFVFWLMSRVSENEGGHCISGA